MIDLESWGTEPDSVIRAAVLVTFSPTDHGEALYLDARPSIDDQLEMGRRIYNETQDWWRSQSPTLSEIVNPSAWPIKVNDTEQIMDLMIRFIIKNKPKYIWSRRCMDKDIIKDLLRSFGKKPPWDFRSEYDCSTFDLLLPKPASKVPHDPWCDCTSQIQHVQNALTLATDQYSTYS